MVGNSTTAGFSRRLGINSLFTGAGAGDLAVRQEIVSGRARLSAGQVAVSGDNGAAKLLAASRDRPVRRGAVGGGVPVRSTALQAFRSQDAKNQVSNLEG